MKRKHVRQRRGGGGTKLRADDQSGVRIRVQDGSSAIEVPFHWAPGHRVYWFDLRRGPVVLEVDMPARPNPAYLVWRAAITTVVALVVWGLLAAAAPDVSNLYVLIGYLCVMGVIVVVWLSNLRPFARREVLEVDSALVALRRDDAYIGVWGRHAIDDTCVLDSDRPVRVAGRSMLGGVPSFIWELRSTSSMSPQGGAGAALAREDAEQVVRQIREFCLEHPTDPDAPKWEGRMPVRSGRSHRRRLA